MAEKLTLPNNDQGDLIGDSTISIDAYKRLVDRCARERLNHAIANGSAFHARILISKLFEIAKREVSLITGVLRVRTKEGIDIYGYAPVIDNAKSFLSDPNTRLSIIIQDVHPVDGNTNRFLKAIVDDDSETAKLNLYYRGNEFPILTLCT